MHETTEPKKMLILYIMEILWKHSDEEHPLTCSDIAKYLRSEYNMDAERKAIRRNIFNLRSFGLEIEWDEKTRKAVGVKDEEQTESTVHTNFRMHRILENCELTCLIDMVAGNTSLPVQHRKEIMDKLLMLGGNRFAAEQKHFSRPMKELLGNSQVLLDLDVIGEAILKKRRIAFEHRIYSVNRKTMRHELISERCTVTPVRTEFTDGRHVLIAVNEGKQVSYRLDTIVNVSMTDEAGEVISVYDARTRSFAEFNFDSELLGEVVELFPDNLRILDVKEGRIYASNLHRMESFADWVISKGSRVTVTSSDALAGYIKNRLEETLRAYA